MSKNFGAVTGYLEPVHRAWEQASWLAGRPPLEREFNLQGELFVREGATRQYEMSSGWVFDRSYFSPDLFPKDSSGDYVVEPGPYRQTRSGGSVTANRFYYGPGQIAHLAGMLITVRGSEDEWLAIDLPAGPSGIGAKRFDLVFLEAWRALVSSDTSIVPTHRDTSGNIFYNGYVDNPTSGNLTYDLYDTAAARPTSSRVQIQWRIRVVEDVDLTSYPDGVDDTGVVFVRGPEIAVTTDTFVNMATSGDPGLWRSATGAHSNTVDGYVYATPICAVARRNTVSFDKDTNQNGALANSGAADSGRPDNARHDVILEKDIIDLRKTVARQFNMEELVQKNFSWLLDGKLKTQWEDSGVGGGQRGTQYTNADEIGPTDTAGANKIGEFDGYKVQFSDALTSTEYIQTVVLADRTTSTSATIWQEGDTFDIEMPATSDGIIDSVVEVYTNSGYSVTAYTAAGLNTSTVTLTLVSPFNTDVPVGDRTSTDLSVRVGSAYPGASGLTRDPLAYMQSLEAGATLNTLEGGDSFNIEGAIPAGMTALDGSSNLYRPSRTATLVGDFTYTGTSVYSRTTTTTVLPHLVASVTGIYDAVADPGKTTNLYVSHSGATITHTAVPATHRSMLVDYVSKEPIPSGTQVTLYYETAAQQALPVDASGINVTDAKVQILYAPSWVCTVTAGSGSHEPGYPYISPGSMIPVSEAGYLGDHNLNLRQAVAVDNFSTTAQFMQLPVMVPFAHVPYLHLDTPGRDAEGRCYYNEVASTPYDDDYLGTPTPYLPGVFAPNLQSAAYHKVLYPCVALLLEDTALGKRGTLVLAVFTYTANDVNNSISFTNPGGSSCVALYRMKGNPTLSARQRLLGSSLVEV